MVEYFGIFVFGNKKQQNLREEQQMGNQFGLHYEGIK